MDWKKTISNSEIFRQPNAGERPAHVDSPSPPQPVSTKLPRGHQFEGDADRRRITRGGQAQDRNGRQERTAASHTIAARQPLTGSCTSCGCSFGCCEREGQRGWRARTPHGHPRWSWLSTPGTCRRQSSCGSPHPVEFITLVKVQSRSRQNGGGDLTWHIRV